MKRGDLNTFFNPKSIAVVGASNTPGKVGHILMEKLRKFKGNVIPINPREKIVHEKTSYKSLSLCPKKIDLVVIATPKKTVLKIIKDAIKKEVHNIIIISAGFKEIGDLKSELKIVKLAEENNLNILGPNCFGITNASINLDLTFSKESPSDGDTVFISQSGALGSYAMDLHTGLRGFISLGNMSDLDFSDWINYFNKDKKTKKIVLYIEKLKEGRRFIEIAKKSSKKIMAVKSGKTKIGQKSTMSHTGSISTEFDVYKAAFKQAKVTHSETLTKAFGHKKEETLNLLKGKHVAIITNAGGAGALLTDELIKNKIKVYGPKDILGTATPNDYKKALAKIQNPYSDIIIIFTPQTMSDAMNTAKVIVGSKWKNKIVALFLGDKTVKNAVKILKENNVKVLTKAI